MVEITNLTFGYKRKQMLFENLNLRLEGGHIYGLLGKNGAGKSTLLKNLIGLAFPGSGTCRIKGLDSARRWPQVLQDLYFVPEEIYVPSVSIRKYVDATAPFYPKFDAGLFEKYLDEFEVPVSSVMSKLSFGQQKKAIVSFALACRTSLLVMDEPTNGLDIPSKSMFRKIVASALTEDQCTVISTHQVRDLDNLIDTIVVLHNNQIVLNKTMEEISDRLSFRIIDPAEQAEALYFESGIRGIEAIMPSRFGANSRVDMELLFNSITGNDLKVLQLINEPYEQHI